jgi:hypothetical protein
MRLRTLPINLLRTPAGKSCEHRPPLRFYSEGRCASSSVCGLCDRDGSGCWRTSSRRDGTARAVILDDVIHAKRVGRGAFVRHHSLELDAVSRLEQRAAWDDRVGLLISLVGQADAMEIVLSAAEERGLRRRFGGVMVMNEQDDADHRCRCDAYADSDGFAVAGAVSVRGSRAGGARAARTAASATVLSGCRCAHGKT